MKKRKNIDNMNISFFNNVSTKPETKTIDEVLNLIKNNNYEPAVTKIRLAIENGEKDEVGELKKALPAFTPSGLFKRSHRKDDLVEYNQVMVLDVDKVSNAQNIKEMASDIPYTYAAFISPSGKGVKILVKTDSTADNHEQYFEGLSTFYEKELELKIDKSGKDFSRLCFLSYDPDLYLNEDAKIFENKSSMTEIPKFEESNITEEIVFEDVVKFTEKVNSYYPGNRNNFVHQLACNLNRIGMDKNSAEAQIFGSYPDLEADEITTTVNSAYNHKDEHGTFNYEYIHSVTSAHSARFARTASEDNIGSTPLIPEEVYENLPKLLKEGVDAFDLGRERDIFLTGAITILSGAFENVYGMYFKAKTKANLFSFTIAPAGSGKGVLRYARKLCELIEKHVTEKFAKIKENDQDITNVPITYYVPADSSSASIKRHLMQNDGKGVMCETEADTLSTTLAQDWGGYSEIIRKAFEHEPISNSRIGKEAGEIFLQKIDNPQLSICISGTPDQVHTLLQSTQNGLFSRFMYYTFTNDGIPIFKNAFDEDGIDSYDEYFEPLSEKVLSYYKKYSKLEGVRFKYTEEQQNKFTKHFDRIKKRLYYEYGNESESIVNRLGKIAFRIAMIFTILRNAELEELPDELICKDIDYDSCIKLADIYIEHSMVIYQKLPGSQKRNPNADVFYEFLPEEFNRGKAVEIGEKFCNIKERTVDKYLKGLTINKDLSQPVKNGIYLKSAVQ